MDDDNYLVKMTTNQPTALKQLFNLIHAHAKELNIYFSPDGIAINYHEELNISIRTELNNEKYAFSEFICQTPISIGVNIGTISALLKNTTNKNILTIYVEKGQNYNENQNDVSFGFFIQNPTNEKVTKMKISILDVNDNDNYELESNGGCKIIMQSSEFLADINELKVNGSDTLQICYHNGTLHYFTKSKHRADIESIKKTSAEPNSSDRNNIINIYVKMSKLIEIVKFNTISKTMTMHINNNSILILEYDINNMGIIYFGIPNVNKPEDY